MNIKELYKENKYRKYRNIIGTTGKEVEIKSIPLKTIKKYTFEILITSLVITLVLLLTFHNSIKTFFIVMIFIIFMVLTGIFFNLYSITSKKDTLNLKWSFQNFELPYSRLKSVFIARNINGLDVFPIPSYNIVIRYLDKLNFIKELSFPLMFVHVEDLKDFLEVFNTEEADSEECIKHEKYKNFKMFIKILGFILFTILVLIALYASYKRIKCYKS